MSTHTYLIASSVGGSILSIFREQAGERVQCSLWNATVDPKKQTWISIPWIGAIYFWHGEPFLENCVIDGSIRCDQKAHSARVETYTPIESILVNFNEEYLIEHPELVESA